MKRARVLIFAVVLSVIPALGQIETLTIPAGSAEDKDLTVITSEQDNQKEDIHVSGLYSEIFCQ
jgi:alcohol dehydrogenase YqhD (iron-dependent ADH family)